MRARIPTFALGVVILVVLLMLAMSASNEWIGPVP